MLTEELISWWNVDSNHLLLRITSVAEAGKDKWAITLQMASTRAADDEPPEGKVAAQHALIWHAQ